jgi:hypothetical protein
LAGGCAGSADRCDALPYLDLQFQVERGQVARTGRYLPVGIMNERAVAWLDRALVAGEITAGTVLFHGPLRGFPFDAGQGRFEVQADVADAVLDYQEGWEPIRDLRARLVFAGAGMEILGHEGRVGPTRLSEVRAHTPDLRRSGPPLRITGQAAASWRTCRPSCAPARWGALDRGLTMVTCASAGPPGWSWNWACRCARPRETFGVQGSCTWRTIDCWSKPMN